MQAARRLLLQLLQAGLDAVDGRRCTQSAVAALRIDAPVRVFALGKAAAAMAVGAHDALGSQLRSALVITCPGHAAGLLRELPLAQLVESAHPLPDARSLAAGATLLEAVQSLDPDCLPLFLVSGGASSLVEVLRDGVSLEDLRRCNAQGLAAGIDIAQFNAQRAQLSRIKGGALAAQLAGRRAVALFISDVPGDAPAVIGSGVLGPAVAGDAVQRRIIANADSARRAVVDAARACGLAAREQLPRFAAEATAVALQCVRELRGAAEDVLAWAGESTVVLPPRPGRGGRNQHLALAAAIEMEGADDLWLLAAGTDGTDGNTEDAGAVVDGFSCTRMVAEGIVPGAALTRADAGSALAASADLIHTGPTGTNVGDLVIGLRLPAQRSRGASRSADMV